VDWGGRESCIHSSIVPRGGLTYQKTQLGAITDPNISFNKAATLAFPGKKLIPEVDTGLTNLLTNSMKLSIIQKAISCVTARVSQHFMQPDDSLLH
jgi:hypothetical protein